MRRNPARRGAFSAVACVIILGACGSSPGAASHVAPRPTSTTAAVDQAAIAAVNAWRDGWNASINGKSSTAFRKHFSGKCSICADNAESLDRAFEEGDHISGGRYAVRSLKVSQRSATTVVVDGVLTQASSKILSGKSVVDRKRGFTERISWKVVLEDGRWVVANLGETL